MPIMTSTPPSTDPRSDAQLADSLVVSAVRVGLITAREVAAQAVELRGSALLLHGQPIAYARPRGLGGASGPATRELRSLRLLAETGLVPEVHGSGEGEVTWIAAVRGERLGGVGGTMAELAEICRRWGAAIATLHLTGTGGPGGAPVAPRPWVLDPDRLPATMRQAPPGSARALVLRTLRGDRGLQRTVSRLADRWTAGHWTHGDLSEAHVLVQHLPDLQVRFIDLRGAGLGDPGWDLAGALEAVAELTDGPRGPWARASAACLSDFLLHGYRRAGGSATVESGTRALRIVSRAWEQAVELDGSAAHPASMHPAAGRPTEAGRLTERLGLARELAARSARTGLLAA
ncbi:MAG TPA: aminoglycoside phosphotransferase family protein [Microlunatus sp.]